MLGRFGIYYTMASDLTVAELDAAIRAVLKKQRYRLMDRDWTFADLEDLIELRDRVIGEERATEGFLMPVRLNNVGS